MSDVIPYQDLKAMASTVVHSGMFPGIKDEQQAMTLFLLAQAEGLHPMTAATRYNIIQGRPAMKADAMLAEFMRRGGTVKWIQWDNEVCEAEFKSEGCPGGVRVKWTIDDAMRAGITGNPTWKKYPRQMLKARVASDGVRMADPAVNQGRYTPEEVESFDDKPVPIEAEVVGSDRLQEMDVEGKSTDDLLANAAKNRAEAIAKYVDEGPEDSEGETIFDKLEAVKEKVAAKVEAETTECPKCGAIIETFDHDGKRYRECHTRHMDRYEGKKRGDSEATIKARAKDHYFKWIGGKK